MSLMKYHGTFEASQSSDRWHIGVLHMKHVFIPLRSPVWLQWRQKGIAATEAAVDCVNSASPLTVPVNVCERLRHWSFNKTARVFLLAAIVAMLFTERHLPHLWGLNNQLNATTFGYLALLFIVIASVAIGLKLVYERKHETSDRVG